MKKRFWFLFLAGVFSGFIISQNFEAINSTDVKSAQKIMNLSFGDAEIDTLLSYLEDNRKGYDSMRTFPLGNEIVPAMSFDPYPMDLLINPSKGLNQWKVDENVKLPKDKESIAFLSIMELAGLIKSRQITSVELTELYLERIKKHDPKLLAFITITEDLAREQARRADAEIASGNYKGPLHGLPYGIKDLAAIPNYPTTW